jgi:hypothetical protein
MNVAKYDVQVCLVSAQTTPNLTPLLDEQRAPGKVVLVVSPDMAPQAGWLEKVIRRKGMAVERFAVPDAYDYYGIADALMDWLIAQGDARVALNVTGGTKLMAMAAQSVFQEAHQPVFYVNAENDEVIVLGDCGAGFTLPQKIKLREYLEVHGYTLEGKPEKPELPAALRELTQELVLRVKEWGRPLGQLNALAQSAERKLTSAPLSDDQLDSRLLGNLVDLFAAQKLVRSVEGKLVFPNEAARQFVNGGWLEFHVYGALADLAPVVSLADYAVNLKVLAADGKTKNELDASFLHRNRLHLIECKAANLGALSGKGESKATDALYKLETLLKMGGLRTRGMLIDYRGGLSDADLARARESRIRVVSSAQLLRLKDEIRNWLDAPL